MKGNYGNFTSTLAMPWLGACVLAGAAAIEYFGRDFALIATMLFWPLLDRCWLMPALPRRTAHYAAWIIMMGAGVALAMWHTEQAKFALLTLATAALPEEWFFRAYFMTRLGEGWRTNLMASILFSLMHGLTRGGTAAVLVFMPSLFYGWLYQRTRDLPLLILVHGLSNILYVLFMAQWIMMFTPDLR